MFIVVNLVTFVTVVTVITIITESLSQLKSLLMQQSQSNSLSLLLLLQQSIHRRLRRQHFAFAVFGRADHAALFHCLNHARGAVVADAQGALQR